MSKKRPKRRSRDSKAAEPAVLESDGLNSNVVIGALIAFALIVRLYYLSLTSDQPVWWDEANYLVKAKSFALGTPETGYDSGRPILFSLLMAPFFSVGLGEFGIRLVISLCSVATVYLTYRIGEKLVSSWAGIFAAAAFSCQYLNLFYTQRVMCEIPYVMMALLGVLFFLSERRELVWASGPCFAVAVMLRYPAFAIPVAVLCFVLFTEGSKALRNKTYWACLALSALTILPDLGSRGRKTVGAASWMLGPRTLPERWNSLLETTTLYFKSMDPIMMLSTMAGLLLSLWYVATWKSRDPKLRRSHLLLLLLVAGPLLLQGIWITHLEDRYLFGALAPGLILAGSAWWHFVRYSPLGVREASWGLAGVALLLACGMASLHSHRVIVGKLESYAGLKVAGEWMKSQGGTSGPVLSRSIAQLTYYSELPGELLPESAEEFTRKLTSGEALYGVLSAYEQNPDWVGQFRHGNNGLTRSFAWPDNTPHVAVLKRVESNTIKE